MSFRSFSKGRASCALARRALLAPFAAVILLAGTQSGAVILSSDHPGQATGLESAVMGDSFDGVGQIQCRSAENRAMTYLTTGWVVGSADTVITAAHSFYKHAEAGRSERRTLDPGHCIFVLYDSDQKVREIANIRYALSPWADARHRNDSSYDVAVLKLERPVQVKQIPSVQVASAVSKPSAKLVAFHTGGVDSQRARITHGLVRAFPANQLRYGLEGTRITMASRMFSTSADSTPGSSGGMYYDARQHAAFGLHIGSLCDTSRSVVSFDADSCFNYGLRFDVAMVTLINMVVNDRPVSVELVTTDTSANQLAMARQKNPGS